MANDKKKILDSGKGNWSHDPSQADYYRCARILPDGTPCGTLVKNQRKNIANHIRKIHREGSYKKNQDSTQRWPCVDEICTKTFKNFHSVLGHMRSRHGFRGKSAPLKAEALSRMAGGKSAVKQKKDKAAESDNDEEDAEDEEEEPFVELPHGPPSDEDLDDDNGPHGTGGAQAVAVC